MSKIVFEYDTNEIDSEGRYQGQHNRDMARVHMQAVEMYHTLGELRASIRNLTKYHDTLRYCNGDGEWVSDKIEGDFLKGLEAAEHVIEEVLGDSKLDLDILE